MPPQITIRSGVPRSHPSDRQRMVVNLKNKNAFVTMLSVKMLVRYAPFRSNKAQEAVLPGYALSCRLSVLCHISSVDQLSC